MNSYDKFDFYIDYIYHIYKISRSKPWKFVYNKPQKYGGLGLQHRITLITKGKIISREQGITLEKSEGDLYISDIIANEVESYPALLPSEHITISFFTNKSLVKYFGRTSPFILRNVPENIKKLFTEAYDLYTDNSFSNYMETKIVLYKIITEAYKFCKTDSMSMHTAMKDALNYIDRLAYEENINIKKLAEDNNLSYEYFIRLFNDTMGCSPKKYINNIRLERVVNLLEKTDWAIDKIASDSGFFNKSYFFQAFKRKYGISPAEYREKNKKYEIE